MTEFKRLILHIRWIKVAYCTLSSCKQIRNWYFYYGFGFCGRLVTFSESAVLHVEMFCNIETDVEVTSFSRRNVL